MGWLWKRNVGDVSITQTTALKPQPNVAGFRACGCDSVVVGVQRANNVQKERGGECFGMGKRQGV